MPKGGKRPGAGRKPGVPNKLTVVVRAAIEEVAAGLGGAPRMILWAQSDPINERVFWSQIYTKLLPIQNELSGKDGTPLTVLQRLTTRDG